MYLKRHYTEDLKTVTHVTLLRMSSSGMWNIRPDLFASAIMDGWLAAGDGKVIMKTDKGNVVFNVTATPGRYCCHCKAPLGTNEEARVHVESYHKGSKSPDSNNLSGWRHIQHYELQYVQPEQAKTFLDKLFGRK